ncbi:MAG TPA: tRNA (N6-threonylcarbamoyladenosine(37)-N6)-methyltransferase TrmO [Chromatiaceae bacterium]|nr:tRNA (N6-threonylcarbamoyladenosine(37)-N6)-methyltransferase TrmO [Chromatiaceae bacterium]HIN82416.1 tRNA (N6-threonylcarbamoyladenosine(37)-N6)-methyltransferase TrmO [Chromatiales bacterium]HIA08225.1 tRNA (N6-threonylcarbamoyladenosine(37)-N6)-methyltransferase TrmO [Chromatiaceae bacterium]HIB85158.1 tRNA (N6-threonylcarbamoyladenosine(37)-N6)-methyltransferase TrmO [Chromatiaceae bacterium]HIO14000.1 tRNA (N6-threonylcarbamoyladenosine(37)-N6)-methyltransferase TrmO [Chromatiales bact
MQPIGYVASPFKQKFGIPRQPGLVPSARGQIILLEPFNVAEGVEGLQGISHLWVSFVFHEVPEDAWRPTVRPPRLGGNTRVGVFASRSPYRPNRLGLSVVKLDSIDTNEGVILNISGLDLLDGTPVLDIKPYIPYCDALPDAQAGYAHEWPQPKFEVVFSAQAESQLASSVDAATLRALIIETLSLDVRPSYHDDPDRIYGVSLMKSDVRWCLRDNFILVSEVVAAGD